MALEIATPDELVYQFKPVSAGSLHFKVRTANDAHIALTSGPEESDPMYEVFIGGWSNTKSVVRKNRTKPDVAEVETPDILSASEFRGFWITWDNGTIAAGKEGEDAPFLTYTDPEPFAVGYYGICTGWGASGTWLVEATTTPGWNLPTGVTSGAGTWVDAAGGEVPDGAVPGGFDGEQLYIARANHEGALIPGKLVPSHGVTYVSWGGGEHGKAEYQVLCGCAPNWVAGQDGQVPPEALAAGQTEEGETLYIGRVDMDGIITLGKVQPGHGVCYIPYGGQELSYPEYEVLVPK